jgi:hypothetical protein
MVSTVACPALVRYQLAAHSQDERLQSMKRIEEGKDVCQKGEAANACAVGSN